MTWVESIVQPCMRRELILMKLRIICGKALHWMKWFVGKRESEVQGHRVVRSSECGEHHRRSSLGQLCLRALLPAGIAPSDLFGEEVVRACLIVLSGKASPKGAVTCPSVRQLDLTDFRCLPES